MTDARRAILGRIDAALRTAHIPTVAFATPAAAPQGETAAPQLQERFVAEARALGVEMFVEGSAGAVRDRVAALIAGRRVLSWNSEHLPYGAGAIVSGALAGSSNRADQARAEVGVTGCHGAIAETGSLALVSRPGCSRTASLLPPVHVAIVEPARLFATMADFFAAAADEIASASNLTFVTGPSRTADIELTLTIGVHGPARVAIVVGP